MEFLNFDGFIKVLKSNKHLEKDNILSALPTIIDENYRNAQYYDDDDEGYEENYQKLLKFLRELIYIQDLDYLEQAFKTSYKVDPNLMLIYDLADDFLQNRLLELYYELIDEIDNDLGDEVLEEAIDNMFYTVKPTMIYYLIKTTANFTIRNNNYEIMKLLINKWKNFNTKGMPKDDRIDSAKLIRELNQLF